MLCKSDRDVKFRGLPTVRIIDEYYTDIKHCPWPSTRPLHLHGPRPHLVTTLLVPRVCFVASSLVHDALEAAEEVGLVQPLVVLSRKNAVVGVERGRVVQPVLLLRLDEAHVHALLDKWGGALEVTGICGAPGRRATS
jgi:hypothetical protein